MNECTVGDVARLSGVSVRTLHHHDQIGLLPPSGRSDAGYRLYSNTDLQRPRQILFYRELGFGLDQVAQILASREADADVHLRRQHRSLRECLERTQALLKAIEHEMEARKMGIALSAEDQFEIFGTDQPDQRMTEADERWGETDAFKESPRRTAAYTKEDWIEIKRQADENIRAFAEANRAGEPADRPVAMALAEAHRQHISRWFYECDSHRHRSLAELYVSDARFSEPWEKIAPGSSRYVHDAILANAERSG